MCVSSLARLLVKAIEKSYAFSLCCTIYINIQFNIQFHLVLFLSFALLFSEKEGICLILDFRRRLNTRIFDIILMNELLIFYVSFILGFLQSFFFNFMYGRFARTTSVRITQVWRTFSLRSIYMLIISTWNLQSTSV